MATANPKPVEELTAADSEESAESTSAATNNEESAEVTSAASNSEETAKKPTAEVDVVSELQALESELPKINVKNTTRLVTLENNLNRYKKFIPEDAADLSKLAEEIKTVLEAKFKSNSEHQATLKTQTEELVIQLESALEAGKSLEALPTWDKIQGNISNTNGDIRQNLQALTLKFKTKINELRDWKIFAATEKKKELIQQIEKLKELDKPPVEKSKLISKMHREWKELGRSNQNEELWQQFKTASDLAYAPCKQFFKERKQVMSANLKARRELCESLEKELKNFQENLPSTADLGKLLKNSEELWKKHAPIEQSRIKPLQKRYYATVNQLRKMRKEGSRGSAKRKTELIEKAKALLQLEDRSQAMSEAKQLQQEWKSAGQSSYKEDKAFWEQFRAVCDEIFARRGGGGNEANRGGKSNEKFAESQKKLEEFLNAIEEMLKLQDEELRAAKSDYQNLQQSFVSALDQIQSKAKNKFRERFNNLKRKLDTRFKSLPDKKSQALLELLQKCLGYLRPLESKLLNSKEADFDAARQSFSEDEWSALVQDSDSSQLEPLLERVNLLRGAKDSQDYQAAAENASNQLRELCIEAEIRAGAETPEDDQAKRMEIQLTQLKQGFGKRQPDRESNIKFVRQSRIKCLCVGPIAEQDQQLFSSRLEKSLQRLI